jgi:hypothetical protein
MDAAADGSIDVVDVAVPMDAGGPDARPQCDPHGPWFLTEFLLDGREELLHVSFDDEELLVFASAKNATTGPRIAYAGRSKSTVSFPPLQDVPGLAGPNPLYEYDGVVKKKGAEVFYAEGDGTRYRIFHAERTALLAPFENAAPIAEIQAPDTGAFSDKAPFVAFDGALWFASNRPGGKGGFDIYRAAQKTSGGYEAPLIVPELSSESEETTPVLSSDGLSVFLGSNRAETGGQFDVFLATRPTTAAPFGKPTLVSTLSTGSHDFPTWISPDGCRLYTAAYDKKILRAQQAR